MSGGSVAGVFGLLQMYKQEKLNSDYKLVGIMNDLADAAYETSKVSSFFVEKHQDARKKAQALVDDENNDTQILEDAVLKSYELIDGTVMTASYKDIVNELDRLEEDLKEELHAEEVEVESELKQEEARNAVLQVEIDNYEKMLSGNVQDAFSYNAGGGS